MFLSDTRFVNFLDFQEFGHRIGLPGKLVEKELNRFIIPSPKAELLISKSFLSPELKKHYLQSMRYRQQLLASR